MKKLLAIRDGDPAEGVGYHAAHSSAARFFSEISLGEMHSIRTFCSYVPHYGTHTRTLAQMERHMTTTKFVIGDHDGLTTVGTAGSSEMTVMPPNTFEPGANDQRESLVNDRRRGTKYEITPKLEEVTAIHGFMNDLDCKMLDPAVVGEACVKSAAALYDEHVRLWLDRDPVLSKAEVRDTGGGLHTILWLDEPIVIASGELRNWDEIARGICNALPGDPNLNGLIALTRPVAAMNTKHNPPREVRQLRPGEPVSRAEILDLSRRLTEQPARLWMRLFFGGERAEPCPFCGKNSLGVAGYWHLRCYECGRANAASLVYRFYSPEFLDSCKENHHG